MIEVTASHIKRDLPGFPDEVIETWIMPLAEDAGWPPVIFSRWDRILMHRPLTFWRALEWEKRRVPLSSLLIEPDSLRRIQGLIDANVNGVNNVFAQQISDTGDRFRGILRYIHQHERLPVPPVLLQVGLQYAVLDGDHRLAAYFHAGPSALGPTCWVGLATTGGKKRCQEPF